MERGQKRPFLGLLRSGWSRTSAAVYIAIVGLVLGLSVASCGAAHHLPKEETVINYKDSTIFHILDSIRITEASRYKDWAGLLDTLTLKTEDGSVLSRSYCDTTRNILAGELEVKPRQEKTRIVYKDRIVKKDSLVFKEIPVEVEKVKEVVPRWAWWSLAFNILGILLIGLFIYLKLKL